MDRLKAFTIFKAVVDNGSFVRAADAMNLSGAVVTRSVQELESLLGVRLLQRTTRSIALTAMGQEVLQRATRLLASYDDLAAVSSLSASEPGGTVRMSAPVFYARRHLGPALASYMMRFPRVWVDLRLREGTLAPQDDDVDLALCVERDLRSSLIAREVALLPVAVYASPGYVARKGAPLHPADLAQHDCLIGEGATGGATWQFRHMHSGEGFAVPARGTLHSNHADVLVGAATHGAGVVLLPVFMVEQAVERNELQRLLPQWRAEPLSVHLAYSSRRNQPLSVRKLIDHLVHALGNTGAADEPATAAPLH